MGKQSAIIVQQAQLSADPSAPASGYSILYPKNGKWYAIDSAGTIIEITNTSDISNGRVDGGMVSWSGAGLVFYNTPAIYYVEFARYQTLITGTATLTTADATFPRIDVIALDTSGNTVVITGTPSANPQTPQIDPSTQVYLTSVLVAAGATTPSGITTTTVFDENTEWTITTTGITINANATIAPKHLTKHINAASGWANGNQITFTIPAGTFDFSAVSTFTFWIYLVGSVSNNKDISIQFLNGTTNISNVVQLTTLHGYNKSTTGSWQAITMQLSAFAFTSYTGTKIRFNFSGNNGNAFYLDWLLLQGGIATGSSPYITNVSRSGDSVYQTINGIAQLTFSLSDKAPALLTGFVSGAGTVLATDTVLQAIQKLTGNVTRLQSNSSNFVQTII